MKINPHSASSTASSRRDLKSARATDASRIPAATEITTWVQRAMAETPVYDLHTHLYPPAFGPLLLRGIDELINYHYLVAESLRADRRTSYETFWALSPTAQADFIWRTLFIERAPLSEACRGVITVLQAFGLDVASRDLAEFRKFFASLSVTEHVDRVMKLANVDRIVMTNDVFDPTERALWLANCAVDPRFEAVLRIDPLLRQWPRVGDELRSFGYDASPDLSAHTMGEVRRFLRDWIKRMRAIYVAVSLTPEWRYPDDSPTTRVIDEAVLPVCRELNLPFALMIGVRPEVNPRLRVAGAAVGHADITSVDRLCERHQENRFMVTMLGRENQHELTVSARKHRNLFLFGCWWFLNNPVFIDEMTRMRMEMLGLSFAPQHSDARVLDQLIYKWAHSREIIARVLTEKFEDIARAGWSVDENEVRRAADAMLRGNFADFLAP